MTVKKPLLLTLALLLFFGLTPGSALAASPDSLAIRYFGPDDDLHPEGVKQALDLIPEAIFVEHLDSEVETAAAQVIVDVSVEGTEIDDLPSVF